MNENLIDNGMKAIKKFNTIHFEVLRLVWFGFLIISIIFSFTSVSGWSNTTFNNSLSSENLTFTGNQNITRYLSVPENTYLTNAYINLTGFTSNYFTNQYTIAEQCRKGYDWQENDGSCYSSLGNDGNWGTASASLEANGWNKNYTILNSFIYNITGLVRYTQTNAVSPTLRLVYYNSTNAPTYNDYTTIVDLNNVANGTGLYYNFTLPFLSLQGSNTSIMIGVVAQPAIVTGKNLYETSLNITYRNITRNVNTTIGNSQVDYKNGWFNLSNNKTVNLAPYINNYLSTCSYSGGYCQVPIQFHSDTAGILQYSDLLFNNVGMVENNISFSPTVYETATQNITLNFTLGSATNNLYTTANLIYNGTTYSSSVNCDGVNCIANRTFDTPLVSSAQNNFTFYWTVTTFDGITSYITNSSINSQTVNQINLTSCTSGNITLNFTFYIENNLTRINGVDFATTFNYYLGSGNVYKNLSYNGISVNESSFCISPSTEQFRTNSIISYGKTGYTTRTSYLANQLINSTVQKVELYLLPSTDATTFIIEVLDQTLGKISGAYVYIQKYYPSTNEYETIQIAQTDSNGETIGFYQIETVEYRHIIIKDGVVLLITDKQKVFPKEVPYTLRFIVGEQIDYPWQSFEKDENLTSSLRHNKTSNVITFSYIDTSSSVEFGELLIKRLSNSNSSETIICESNSTLSSSTLNCDMSSYSGSFIAYGLIDGEVTDVLPFSITTAKDIFGREGLLIGMFIIMVAGFAFIWNPTAGFIGINVAIIFVNMMGFITVSPIFIFGSIATSIIAIILLKT